MSATAVEVQYTPFATGAKPSSLTSISGGSLGAEIRQNTSGVRLTLRRFGANKKLDAGQIVRVAEEFEAVPKFIGASKRILNTDDKLYRSVTKLLSGARHYWNIQTIEYPAVRGVRLIRKSRIEQFEEWMKQQVADLDEALDALQAAYDALRNQAKIDLGELYKDHDYPPALRDFFAIEWDYPSIEPPDYLRELHPDIWQREQAKISAQFEEAAQVMENAFALELEKLVQTLAEKLKPGEDGKTKVFRDSAVENFSDFFKRFREVSVSSSEQLDRVVSQAMGLMHGIAPEKVRSDEELRADLAEGLSEVQSQLAEMIVNRPTRMITLEDDE